MSAKEVLLHVGGDVTTILKGLASAIVYLW
jgi:hypothetical protein